MKYTKIVTTTLFALLINTSPSFANVIGSDLENFNPTTDGLGYVTVESTEIHEPGHFNLGLFLDYGFNTLPTVDGSPVAPDDTRLATNIHGAVGVIKGWSLGFSITNLIDESANDASFAAGIADTGSESFRLDSKIRVLAEKKASIALLAGVNFNNIDNNPYLGQDPGPSIYLGGVYERHSSRTLSWAANLGYRLRNSGDAIAAYNAIGPIENQVFYSLGVNYLYEAWKMTWFGELYGSLPTNSPVNSTDRDSSNLEALLGAKWRFLEKVDVHAGVTRGIYSGLSTPDLRIYAGFNWYFGPPDERGREKGQYGGAVPGYEFVDRDGDGVDDSKDRCANTPKGALVDRYGCTMNKDRSALDDDFDGVDNIDDECPNTPTNVEVDRVGCETTEVAGGEGESMDSDGDGVLNGYDLCPNTPQGVQVTKRGCEPTRITKYDLGKLNFISGTDKLTKKSRLRFMKKINKLVEIKRQIKSIFIEGHTDSVGKASYNLRLSNLRAKTIRRILIKQTGISGKKVSAKGYGESRPIATNKTKRGRLLNRRVEMNVITK